MASPTFTSSIKYESDVVEGSNVSISDDSSIGKILVRAASDTQASQTLSVEFGKSRDEGSILVAGTRPDEFMLLGDHAEVIAAADALDDSGHVSIIDWTHGRVAIRVTGTATASVLEKLCAIDFTDVMFPDGAVVSASVAKTGCDMVRNDIDGAISYLIMCDRSFGQYLFGTIVDAASEFGVSTLPPKQR